MIHFILFRCEVGERYNDDTDGIKEKEWKAGKGHVFK